MPGPVNSGLQMQALTDVLAVGLLVFGAHLIHGELSVLYCLRRRAMHWDMIVLADRHQDSNSLLGTIDKAL